MIRRLRTSQINRLAALGKKCPGTTLVEVFVNLSASELLHDVFGRDKNLFRLVYGVASLPL